jgi:exosome complex exonuclease DIS3/RRP44
VRSLGRPDLLDLLVQPSSEDVDMEELEDFRMSKRKVIYTEVCCLSLHIFIIFGFS